ncbi:MAG: N-acetylmuramic acid 6-phosphate etherase [Actinomycetota bacterium]|nr:N-acetylmuramic acid 6-phosphate etherase [Actinomycetota bacterium]
MRIEPPTEQRNPRTADIDTLDALALLERINDEDATVVPAVRAVLQELATLVNLTVASLHEGGTVHYFGAGTSGRMAFMDAAEIPPTFGVSPDRFQAHIAGGPEAFRMSREGAEDDDRQGMLDADQVTCGDVAVGVAASGRTPYVEGALRHSRSRGAHTALITSNPFAPLRAVADTFICVDTGPEVLTGSTRMKAGTAQKLVLNAFSTAVMVRSGRTWSNLMVGVLPTNTKLRSRAVGLVAQATGLDRATCRQALVASDGEVTTALVMLMARVTTEQARYALAKCGGSITDALASMESMGQ